MLEPVLELILETLLPQLPSVHLCLRSYRYARLPFVKLFQLQIIACASLARSFHPSLIPQCQRSRVVKSL